MQTGSLGTPFPCQGSPRGRGGSPAACCDKPQGTFTLSVSLRDAAPPALVSGAPTDRKKNVSPKANVTATFSEAMDAASFDPTSDHLSLARKGSSRAVPAKVYLNSAKTKVSLDPGRKLRLGETYVATVRAGAKDATGNTLATGRTWRFTIRR